MAGSIDFPFDETVLAKRSERCGSLDGAFDILAAHVEVRDPADAAHGALLATIDAAFHLDIVSVEVGEEIAGDIGMDVGEEDVGLRRMKSR